MIRFSFRHCAQVLAIAGLLVGSAVEARKKKPVPPPPAPPAPRYIVIPWKPIPPEWAAPTTRVPPLGPDGLRVTVNRNISPAQTTWNLRSGYNVAALNCRDVKHAEIVINYRAFLKTHAKSLRSVNAKIDSEWRAKYGAGFVRPREKYMTEVYNHFAMPPTLPAFCDATLAISKEGKLIKLADLNGFGARGLPNIEIVFDDFYRRFDAYKVDMAAWETKWGKDAVPGSSVLESAVKSTM